jgi:dipeptidyl aminopeptidase/acylaminoacyl peptidase
MISLISVAMTLRPFRLVLLCFLASAVSAADKPNVTLDEFFNYVDFPAVQISPDGNSVVIISDRADWDREIFQTDLWLYRVAGQNAGSLTQLTHSGRESSPQWSPDGRWIAFLSERKSVMGKPGKDNDESTNTDDKDAAQLYLISPDGGEAFPITSGADEIHAFAWSADSKSLYFATRVPWNKNQKEAYQKIWKDTVQYRASERGDVIFKIDLADPVAQNAASGKRETPEAEKDAYTTPGAVPMASTPWRVLQLTVSVDGRRMAFVTTSISERQERYEDFEIYVVDLAHANPSIAPRQLTRNEGFEQELTWAKDNQHLFFAIEYGAAEGKYQDFQKRLYWLDADTGKMERWAADFKGAVLQHDVLPNAGAITCGRIGTEVPVYTQDKPGAIFSKKPGWPGTYESISAAHASTRVAFVYSSVDRPAEVYLAESAEQLEQARPITAFNQLFTERNLPQGRSYQWTAEDGTKIEAMLIYPPGRFGATNLPMFTLIHGGPDDADGNHFEMDWYQWDRLAANDGWLVFEPNYRGSIGYGDAFRQGIIPELVSRPGRDILSGIDALVKDGIADPHHLTVGGYSYGGYLTNWLITQTPRFRAAVTGAGAVEHASNWGNDDMTADDAYYLGGRPWEAPQRYLSEAAIYQFGKVRTPTHVVVGGEDVRVAVSEAYLLDRALHSLGVPSSLLVFPGENHSLDKNPWHGKIKVREELKWLQTYGGIHNAQ